jgi:hypothetical protein
MGRATLATALGAFGEAVERRAPRKRANTAPPPPLRVVPDVMPPQRAVVPHGTPTKPLAAVPSCTRCDTPASGDGSRWWCAECGVPVTLPRA